MFKHIELPELATSTKGLQPAVMRDLAQVVLVAGPNGGGKTRYLDAICQAGMTGAKQRHDVEMSLHSREEQLVALAARLASGDRHAQEQIRATTASRDAATQRLASLPLSEFAHGPCPVMLLRPGDLTRGGPADTISLPAQQLFGLMATRAPSHVHESFQLMTHYLTGIAVAFDRARHRDHENDDNVKDRRAQGEAFNRLLEPLLGTTVTKTLSNNVPAPALFGRPFQPQELSPGQRLLLAWAISLHAKADGGDLASNAVIAIDEPELHLHPAAAVDVVQRMYTTLIEGTHRQLWLATHSPSLVAHFGDIADLYEARGSGLHRATKDATRVMESLLGGVGARDRLRSFLDDAEATDFARFVVQCVLDAGVSERIGERQSAQFLRILGARDASAGPLRILDYGSGKARFALALAEEEPAARERIDYRAYDDPAHDSDRAVRARNLVRAFGVTGPARSSNDISDFAHERRVDLVVMANFLHEVPPIYWREHFTNSLQSLREGGALVVFEDQQIAVGELPNPKGFILMNLAELRTLLGTTEGVEVHQAADARCSAFLVSRAGLEESLKDAQAWTRRLVQALEAIKGRAAREIRIVRGDESPNGVAHARAIVLLANATIALGELTGSSV